jgi:hypothetical protein
MLIEIITREEVYSVQLNLFACAKGELFSERIAIAFFMILSAGILIAHALDAFRP